MTTRHLDCFEYTLNKSSKWYTVYICRVFRKGLNADKFYPYLDFQCTIKIHSFDFAIFKVEWSLPVC